MSNDNNGLSTQINQTWGAWFLSWIFWLFFKSGQMTGSVARRTSKVPGKTKKVAKGTWKVTKEAAAQLKDGYIYGRTEVVEDAEEIK